MSVLWVTEAVPLAVTALLPAVLFPTLGIATSTETCEKYLNDALALFFGGFVVARVRYCVSLAVSGCGLTRRTGNGEDRPT